MDCEEASQPTTDCKEVTDSVRRHFDKAFLRTWPAVFKIAEAVFCFFCFVCNETSSHRYVPCRFRTFLSVCACLALVSSILLFLVCGYHVNRRIKTAWWRIVVVAAPGTCALILMVASAILASLINRVHLPGFSAATAFGFLACGVYLADTIYHIQRRNGAWNLPCCVIICLPYNCRPTGCDQSHQQSLQGACSGPTQDSNARCDDRLTPGSHAAKTADHCCDWNCDLSGPRCQCACT